VAASTVSDTNAQASSATGDDLRTEPQATTALSVHPAAVTVTNDIAHPLKIFEETRRALADATTVEQINRIVAWATGLAAAARKATDREPQ
jgi:hypothetical protein